MTDMFTPVVPTGNDTEHVGPIQAYDNVVAFRCTRAIPTAEGTRPGVPGMVMVPSEILNSMLALFDEAGMLELLNLRINKLLGLNR